ncbi:MAG: DNA glycosylase [Chloroflexi bacterium]|nr:DNA glycosylase [Chloroflexota bacterium]
MTLPSAIPSLRQALLRWFRKHARSYPWRETDDPYKVLVAELMLRRTQADQVWPVYEQFIAEFPDAQALDGADEARVEEVVYPLGLHWRAPAFKKVVREVGEKYGYRIPDSREELTALPGVGDYVAGAILSVAYGKQEWIVDTNVARVLRRYYGLKTIKEARRDKQIVALAREYACGRDPRSANLAMLDFAALVCTALRPECPACPLRRDCADYALRQASAAGE